MVSAETKDFPQLVGLIAEQYASDPGDVLRRVKELELEFRSTLEITLAASRERGELFHEGDWDSGSQMASERNLEIMNGSVHAANLNLFLDLMFEGIRLAESRAQKAKV